MTKLYQKKTVSKLDGADGPKLSDEFFCTKQVPSDVFVSHDSDTVRANYNDSDSSCDLIADEVENFSLDKKRGSEISKQNVMPKLPLVGLELSKVELSYFDGQPKQYWRFIRQFETYVASRVSDDSQRLLYLIHYCKGKAKAATEGCVGMDAAAGYKRAREILKRLFGQAHIIARDALEDLFNTENFDYNNVEYLSNLVISMENCCMILEQMNYTADLNSLVTLERVMRLLPQPMQMEWAELVDRLTENDRDSTFAELTQFVAARERVASSRFGQLAERPKKGAIMKSNYHSVARPGKVLILRVKCSKCSGDHAVYEYTQFLALTTEERWSHVKRMGICFACLKQGHKAIECKVMRRCTDDGCPKRHHSLLHNDSANRSEDKLATVNCCRQTKPVDGHVCFGMIPVRLRSSNAEIVGYALLDNGSDTTLLRSDCLKSLGLTQDKASVMIQTVGGKRTARITKSPLKVYSLDQSEHVTIDSALVVSSITEHMPTKSALSSVVKWPHLADVPLDIIDSGEVLLLIGCNVPEAHWVLDQRLGGRKHPYAVKTLLGWTVFGPASCADFRKRVVNHTNKVKDQFVKEFIERELSKYKQNHDAYQTLLSNYHVLEKQCQEAKRDLEAEKLLRTGLKNKFLILKEQLDVKFRLFDEQEKFVKHGSTIKKIGRRMEAGWI